MQTANAATASSAPDDLQRQTPCPDWKVGDLLAHLAANTEQLGKGYAGEKPPREVLARDRSTGRFHKFGRPTHGVRSTAAPPSH